METNNTITKIANGSFSIAKAILEMAQNGYVPIEYHLPKIVFGLEEEFERKELYPEMQSLVEEAMVMILENKNKEIEVSFKNLINFFNNGQLSKNFSGRDAKIILNDANQIDFVLINKNADISNLSFTDLKELFNLIKNHKSLFSDNKEFKQIRLDIYSRLKKLKRSLM